MLNKTGKSDGGERLSGIIEGWLGWLVKTFSRGTRLNYHGETAVPHRGASVMDHVLLQRKPGSECLVRFFSHTKEFPRVNSNLSNVR